MSSAAVFTAVVLLCTSLRGASTEAIHKPSFENLGELHQREGNAMSAALDEATARIRLQNALAASLQKVYVHPRPDLNKLSMPCCKFDADMQQRTAPLRPVGAQWARWRSSTRTRKQSAVYT